MALKDEIQLQDFVRCDPCQQPVSFFCRRCGVNLCDRCALRHLRLKSKNGHDIVDYISKDDDDTDQRDYHSYKFVVLLGCFSLIVLFLLVQNNCSAYCETCDVPICVLCASIKHKSHEMSELSDKIKEPIKVIVKENDRLQSSKHELERILDHMTKLLSSISSMFQVFQNEVTARGEEWHKQNEETVKKFHQGLDDMQKEHEAVQQKQKKEFEEIIEKVNEIYGKTLNLQKFKNARETQTTISKLYEHKKDEHLEHESTEKQLTGRRIIEVPTVTSGIDTGFPANENSSNRLYGKTLNLQKFKNARETKTTISKLYEHKKDEHLEHESTEKQLTGRRIIEVPTVTSVIDTGFPANENSSNRLYDMAVTNDNKVWMGGYSRKLKLFDLQGHLKHTVRITTEGLFLCMYNKQVVFIDQNDNAVKTIYDTDFVMTMFSTGDWRPYGVTSTTSGDLLVCLHKDDQSKVVRYSSNGTVLQEIQYDWQGQPLYIWAIYITENVNGDIIVTDWEKNAIIAVDRLGIYRYSYSGKDSAYDICSVATDSVGHVIVTDFNGNKIHILDRDGRFLRYIIPEGGIKYPRAVCILDDVKMMVGECLTGIAKIIKYLED